MSGLALPKVIGHRGAAAHAPENTLAGFLRAAQLGARWVELDVQLTADGVPVVFHDDGLERTTDGEGRLLETSLVQLRRLDAGARFAPQFAGERVPTLAEALTTIAGAGLGVCLEIKAGEARGAVTAERAIAVARQQWPANAPTPLVSSFALTALAVAAEAAPEWPRGYLLDRLGLGWADRARRLGCASLHVNEAVLDEQSVRTIKDAGFGLLAYTVNDRQRARRLWGWGVDGLFTDRPDDLIAADDLAG